MTISKVLAAASVLILGGTMAVRKARQMAPPVPIALTIKTHGVQLSQQDAIAIINQSKTFLPQVQIRVSSITAGSGPADLKTCADTDALFADKSANVHIVNSIGCCANKQAADFGGCSAGPNLPIIALPVDTSHHPENVPLVAVQWMHELGHNRGLCHTKDLAGLLMAPTIGVGNTATDQCEINAFLGLPAASCTSSCGQQSNRRKED